MSHRKEGNGGAIRQEVANAEASSSSYFYAGNEQETMEADEMGEFGKNGQRKMIDHENAAAPSFSDDNFDPIKVKKELPESKEMEEQKQQQLEDLKPTPEQLSEIDQQMMQQQELANVGGSQEQRKEKDKKKKGQLKGNEKEKGGGYVLRRRKGYSTIAPTDLPQVVPESPYANAPDPVPRSKKGGKGGKK